MQRTPPSLEKALPQCYQRVSSSDVFALIKLLTDWASAVCMRIFYDVFPVMPVKGNLEYTNGGTSLINTFPESQIACSFISVCVLKVSYVSWGKQILKLFLPKYFVLMRNIGIQRLLWIWPVLLLNFSISMPWSAFAKLLQSIWSAAFPCELQVVIITWRVCWKWKEEKTKGLAGHI